MSRRGEKRRKKRRSKQRVREPVEVAEFGPLTVVRDGSIIQAGWSEIASEEDMQRLREAAMSSFDKIPERIAHLNQELRDRLARHDAYDIVGALWLRHGFIRPATYVESSQSQVGAIVEYAASILAERPSRDGEGIDPLDLEAAAEMADEMIREIIRLLLVFTYHRLLSNTPKEAAAFAEVRAQLLVDRLIVRGDAYEDQEVRTLADLFDGGPVGDRLAELVGFSVNDALTLARATMAIQLEKLYERGQRAQEVETEMKRRLEREPADTAAPLLAELRDMPKKKATRWLRGATQAWWMSFPGQTMQFTAADLSEFAAVPLSAVQAFLDCFALPFSQAAVPPGEELFRSRAGPILDDGKGQYLCVAPWHLVGELRDVLEQAIRRSGERSLDEAYQKHRADVLERRAMELLTDALKPREAHRNLRYDLPEDGLTNLEVDGVSRVDSIAVLLEAKAGALPASAKRAAPLSLEDKLKELARKADRQLSRADSGFAQGKASNVHDDAGVTIRIDTTDITRSMRVAVTLDNLTMAPMIWQLVEAGIVESEDPPWFVSLHDLETIVSLVESPAQLVHYVQRRAQLNRQRRVWAHDELDLFMHYLAKGLFFDEVLEGDDAPSLIQLGSFTDELDAYRFGQLGLRKPVPKPRQKMPPKFRAILAAVESVDTPIRIDVACALLDMGEEGRSKVGSLYGRFRRQTIRDGTAHDFTMLFGGCGFTAITYPGRDAEGLSHRLQMHCLAKKHQLRARRWVGIGTCAGGGRLIDAMFYSDSEPKEDPEMDALVRELGLQPPPS